MANCRLPIGGPYSGNKSICFLLVMVCGLALVRCGSHDNTHHYIIDRINTDTTTQVAILHGHGGDEDYFYTPLEADDKAMVTRWEKGDSVDICQDPQDSTGARLTNLRTGETTHTVMTIETGVGPVCTQN